MSLRDQLVAKGLASSKDAQKARRDLKKQRKDDQGSKKRKGELRREQEAAAREEQEARRTERLEARKEREAIRDRHEHALRVRNLILGNRLKNRGDHPFHFVARDGRTILRMMLHRRVAEEIARGSVAIAWLDHGNRDEYVLISRSGAEKLAEIGADGVVVHRATGEPDVSELPVKRDWEPALGPHRVR